MIRNLLFIFLFAFVVSCGNSIDVSVKPADVAAVPRTLSWQAGNKIGLPLSFGDQNFPTASAQTTNGNIFLSSVISDSPGWERWVVFKSTNNGVTFSKIDQYVPYEDGESHPLSMVAKGNDLYVCGYVWDLNDGGRTKWSVRKTSDGGNSWSISDFINSAGNNEVCYDIDKSASGSLITVGEDAAVGGIIRESKDNGATWNTIYTSAAVVRFTAVRVSPAGAVWAVGDNGNVYRGTFAAGWTFNLQGTTSFPVFGAYDTRGDLEILSETNALLSYQGGGNWIVERTTDTGATWATTFTSPANGEGHGIRLLSGGEVIAVGSSGFAPRTALIEKSTDGGATWTNVYSNNTYSKQNMTVLELASGDLRSFGEYYNGGRQIFNLRSSDNGDTWIQGADIIYREKLYHDLYKLVMDGTGNLWATGYVGYIDSTFKDPWVVVKSSDKGATWTESDVFTDPANWQDTKCLAAGPAGAVYAAGSLENGDQVVRKTANSGASWSEVDRSTDQCFNMTVTDGGDVFFISNSAGNWLRKGATNGTVWSRVTSFPVEVGATSVTGNSLKAFPDGSLWLGVTQLDGGATQETVIYRSVDNGVTFTEVYSDNNFVSGQEILYRDGSVFIITPDNKVKRTDDDGATWVEVYDGTILGTPKDIALDTEGKLFVMNTNDQVLAQTSLSGGHVLSLDYSTFNTSSTAYLFGLESCGSSTGICAIGSYSVSVEGTVYQFIPLDY